MPIDRDPFLLFGARRGANPTYGCAEQVVPPSEPLSAHLDEPSYRVESSLPSFSEFHAASQTEAARILLKEEWMIASPTDDQVFWVALAFMDGLALSRLEIEGLVAGGSPAGRIHVV